MTRVFTWGIIACLALLAAATTASAQFHEGDIGVARSSAGKLVIFNFNSGQDVVFLNPVDGLLKGWTNPDPGFDSITADDPGNDLFLLEPGAEIRIEVVSMSLAFKAWGPGLTGTLANPAESLLLGDHNLHRHLTWHADSEDPAFHSGMTDWGATLKLVDTGSTGYEDSDSFLMKFTNRSVPAVSTWGLVVLTLLTLTAGTMVLSRRQAQW